MMVCILLCNALMSVFIAAVVDFLTDKFIDLLVNGSRQILK